MNFLIELLFPRRCAVCDKSVDKMGRYVCKKCMSRLVYVEQPLCMKCGKHLKDDGEEYCEDCKNTEHIFDRSWALYEYETVKESIYRLKYEGRIEYADFFGKELSKKFGKVIKNCNVDVIVPVPLYAERERKRGYNQAELLAKAMGKALDIPVDNKIIYRTRNTMAQKQLNVKERQNNLKNAFKIGENDVKLKIVVVVDDIYTTGATMDEVAMCLKQAGALKVYGISLAIGKGM